MPKYLFHGSFTQQGLQGVMREGGTSRTNAVAATVASLGGTMESYYFAFGKDSYYIVADVPSDEAAAALAMTVTASGAVNNVTTKLLTADQVDAAIKMSPTYRAPGQ